jgi:hypothetical protein
MKATDLCEEHDCSVDLCVDLEDSVHSTCQEKFTS